MRCGFNQRAAAQPLHSRRPLRHADGLFAHLIGLTKRAQRRYGGAGILQLMRPGQVGQRQIQKTALVLVNHPAIFSADMPVLAMHDQRRAKCVGLGFDHLKRGIGLRAHHQRHAALNDAGLFTGNFRQGFAQKLLVVDRDRRDDAQRRLCDHIGGIQTAAKSDLKQGIIGRAARHAQQRGAGGDFKIGNIRAIVGFITFIQQSCQIRLSDQCSCQPDTFVKPRQMRRCIGMHALVCGLKTCADHGQCAAFAVGAGNMHHGRYGILRIVQSGQQPPDAVQCQVNHFGVQRHHPLKDDVGSSRCHGADFAVSAEGSGAVSAEEGAGASGFGRSPLTAGLRPSSIRVMVISSSRISPRGVTRSSMP